MKQYQQTSSGSYQIGNMSIPADPANSDYAQMQAELAANKAEIIPATAPTVAELIDAAKTECRRRILNVYPDWKQANMTARGVELTDKKVYGGSLTVNEETERQALQAVWAWIRSMRTKSDLLEVSIVSMTEEERRNLNVMDNTHWA